ncbi:hypothetical protein [Paenibacillus sp. Root444D2]|uniref:hypothetical protein n=1 Tax=Paenibacillus sp. Root444D2 TaxID=1736538 RepID=UPI0007110D39|nr:hypothetical protein [Paenibacillus sp. Root444D2]KQX56640.1 hypothetical protein ASD40_04365 [Paenibacillus sp. Root444D2]
MIFIVKVAYERARVSVAMKNIATVAGEVSKMVKVRAERMIFNVKVAYGRMRVSIAMKNIARVAGRVPKWLKCELKR